MDCCVCVCVCETWCSHDKIDAASVQRNNHTGKTKQLVIWSRAATSHHTHTHTHTLHKSQRSCHVCSHDAQQGVARRNDISPPTVVPWWHIDGTATWWMRLSFWKLVDSHRRTHDDSIYSASVASRGNRSVDIGPWDMELDWTGMSIVHHVTDSSTALAPARNTRYQAFVNNLVNT